MINKQLLQKRFSQHASTYDQYAKVQKKMGDWLLATIPERFRTGKQCLRILEIGCGTGYVTQQLCEIFPDAYITAVDIAQGMIEQAQKRVGNRVQFMCSDVEEMDVMGQYDIIISNATFQWFNHFPQTFSRLIQQLSPQGVLCFSTFGERTFHELHQSFRTALHNKGIDQPYTPGQTFYSLDELQRTCEQAMELTGTINAYQCDEIEWFPTVRDFLNAVKKIGANNSNQAEHCQRPSVLKEMMSRYELNYGVDGEIPATYHCLFFACQI